MSANPEADDLNRGEENIAIGDRFTTPILGNVEVVDIYASATSGLTVFRVKDEKGFPYLVDKDELTPPPEAI